MICTMSIGLFSMVYADNMPTQLNVNKNNIIESSSNDAENIMNLKRRLEIEKIKSDINQTVSRGDNKSQDFGNTIVTSVLIDQNNLNGGKYATLKFIDGGVLDVEVGSIVGTYRVTDIAMNGVSLMPIRCLKKSPCVAQLLRIDRMYGKQNIDSYSNNNLVDLNAPTPIINNRIQNNNTVLDSAQMVPPIVTK